MPNTTYTGNSLLDRLIAGPYSKNPEYNPKTKAGKTKPQFITDTSAGDINSGRFTNLAKSINELSFTGRDLGLTNKEIEEDADNGITMSPYNTDEELNKARADNQGAFEQFGNFLMQAGVGEVILGTLEGFGNIADGVINSFTGDNYGKNAYTEYMENAKNKLKDNFKIYREDPNATFAFSDFGWWMDNAVSVATTASLLLPAAGWARGLSYAGKVSKLNSLGKMTSRVISKGIAKATTKAATAGKLSQDFGAIRSAAATAGRIDKSIRNGAGIVGTAYLSRTGENYMEAKAIYEDVYTNSKENLDNMPANEFAKFINRNPEFKDMSKDDIAKEIAIKSANKTFWNDYWMLLMDIPQFKALGSIWGKGAKRASTASERIAAANQKKLLAGATNEQLIKNNILNRTKEGIKYALKNPKDSFLALELGEGFEEMYQGVQSEKGMEVATKYFDPNFTSRTLGSYIKDSSIWEQGLWGTIGGIAFNKIGRGLQKGSRAIEGLWNKKHMTAEDYEKWKRSTDKIAIEQINSVTERTKKFISDMEQINNGTNPFNFVIDKTTGRPIIKDGDLVNESVDEEQKDLLKERAIRDFVDGVTLDAVDSGTIDLMKDIIGSREFDKFIADNGLQLSASDKALSSQVVDRMNEVSGIYYNALNDINSLTEDSNPFITINAARDITRNKLMDREYDLQLDNISSRMATANDTNADYSAYEEKAIYDAIQNTLTRLKLQRTQLKTQYENEEIGKSAYELHDREIEKNERALLDLAARSTTRGAIDSIKESIKDLNYNTKDVIDALDTFINDTYYGSGSVVNANNTPSETIDSLIKQKARVAINKAFTTAKIPVTKKDFEDLYNEFSFSMDAIFINKAKAGIEKVKKYLREADDFDEALSKIMNENTENKELNDILQFLKYGYFDRSMQNGRMKGQLTSNLDLGIAIEETKAEREKAENRAQEAAEQGVVLPENDTDSSTNNTDSPSTGSETKTDTVVPTRTAAPVVTETSATATPITENPAADNAVVPENPDPGVQTTREDNIVVDNNVPIDKNPLDLDVTEKELQEQAAIAAGYETASLKASLDASKYVMQVGFKESGRLDAITKALSEGDASKYEEFIKEITDFLISRGYDKRLAEVIAKKSFTNTVASFGAMDSKSTFGKLAQQLAMGFGSESAKQYSITELIDGKGLDEIVEEFIDEYSNLVGNDVTINGVHIINMESLFDYILSNKDIDKRTAAYIYNNIGTYISTHDGSKYKFTGFNPSRQYSAEEFFNRINKLKSTILSSSNNMHISPIEPDQRTKDYTDALIAAANGATAYCQLEGTAYKYGVIDKEPNGRPRQTHIAVYVNLKKGKKLVPVKIGILRTVTANEDFSSIEPVSHYSGFRNEITIGSNGNISLDCDFLFNALINDRATNTDAKQLFTDLAEYYSIVGDIASRLFAKKINERQARKELSEAMPLDKAERILSNPLIAELLSRESYKFYDPSADKITRAKKLSRDIAAILFYKSGFNPSDINNGEIDNMAIDSVSMRDYYEDWKRKVYENYTQTYELQKGLIDENSKVEISVNAEYFEFLNTIENKEDYVNIDDAGFDIDKNSPNYTPLVIVNQEGHLIDEEGNDYGQAPIDIANYSMGFLVHNKDGVQLVAYFNEAAELKGSDIFNSVKFEIANLISKQLYNTVASSHDANFEDIIERLIELFNPKSPFIFNNFNTILLADRAKTMATIAVKDSNNRQKNLITFYKTNRDGITNSNAVGLYIPRLGRQVPITNLKDTRLATGEIITEQEIRDALNNAILECMASFKLNKSFNTMMNRTTGNGTSRYHRRENGKFIINLAGKDYVYENYGDFMLKNRGFTTNVDGSKKGFVSGYLNENRITINTAVKDSTEDVSPTNTFVSDLLFNNKNKKRKTVDTKAVLEAAGVPKDKIDVLLGTNSGMPIVTKRVRASDEEDSDTNAYYNVEDNNIYITQKGAAAMNNNPTNAIRLILHENLHRLFHNKQNYTNSQRERIVKELREVYDYTREQLDKDRANGKISEVLYNSIISVFDKATVSDNEMTRMEEFLMECLTQPVIVDYLNNTAYHSEANIEGISQKAKSIFQKIMDILLDLLGINTNRIKNNSILAREYIILSRTDKDTNNGIFNKPVASDNVKPPVERTLSPTPTSNSTPNNSPTTETTSERLAKVRKEIDEVRQTFESRIKRSDNFTEDHTYYIDGKPADTSVTQQVHGKQDIGAYGVPSSILGNTADEAARVFFENNGRLPDDYNVPNTTNDDSENSKQALERDLNKIKDYLDKRFGKGRYGVITEEFPIGGIINVEGADKTIAGTMDMIVYTDNGDIYIFDFKTKRMGDTNAEWDEHTINSYYQQVNIYRQLIAANFPNLAGRVKTGALIKFITDYPAPSKDIKYRENPNVPNQLQVKESEEDDFVNIQDSFIDYNIPYFFGDENFEDAHIFDIKDKDFVYEIKPLNEQGEESINTQNIAGSEQIQDDDDFDFDSFDFDDVNYREDIDDTDDTVFKSSTNLIDLSVNNDTNQSNFTKEEQEILKNAPRNAEGRLLAPNGKVSNLTEKQYAQVRTKAFKNWFGDWTKITFDNNGNPIIPDDVSKVVDENGEPLVVYHGNTDTNITKFTKGKGRYLKDGNYYFSPSKSVAESYATNGLSEEIDINDYLVIGYNVDANSEEAKYADFNSAEEFFNASLGGKVYSVFLNIKNPLFSDTITPKIENLYDGAITIPVKDTQGTLRGEKVRQYIATESNQIKSATDNIGTFDANNPDIRYAKTELITPSEIYAPAVANGSTDNPYGIQIVNNMRSYIDTFPAQYRDNIKQLLANDELNYTCQ